MDSRRRFSDRVEAYVRSRPTYPSGVIRVLTERLGLGPDWVVADLGSGTGISSKLFVDNGNTIIAVEPNAEMRHAAERVLGVSPRFRSVDGSAEDTGLEGGSVDLVVAAQAFHWFDPKATRRECVRILRKPRRAALFWNTRLTEASDFARGYERLLERFGTDYVQVRDHRAPEAGLENFFDDSPEEVRMPNAQLFDFDGLRERLLSSSYAPSPGHPDHEPMIRELRRLFEEHRWGGFVRFDYDTQLFFGDLERSS